MGSTFDYTQEERQRDVTAGLYQKFYIETPVEGIVFSIGAEAAGDIEVGLQVADPAGDALLNKYGLEVIVCSDAVGDTPAASDGLAVSGVGAEITVFAAAQHVLFATDENGNLELTVTKSSAGTLYLAVKLPNGEYIVSEALTYA